MNILVLSWRDPKHPLAGGAEQVMHQHMKGWVLQGHSITLFASKMEGLPSEEELDSIKIVRRGYQYWGVQFAAFFYYLKNKSKFDLIVDQFHGLPFFTPLYVRKIKVAVIQEIAGKVWFLNPFSFPLNYIVAVIGYIGEPFLFLIYKKVNFITGSNSTSEALQKVGIKKSNIHIIPHGVILSNLPKEIKKEKVPTFMYLGVISRDKGIEDAIECFSILKDKGYKQFWVVGKYETKEYFEGIRSKVAGLGLTENVKFWGYVSLEKKFELLARAHLLINPSVHEGWGLVNIEANACQTPVVSYNSSGLVDSVKDGESGIVCTKNSPEKMALIVHKLILNKLKYKRMQKKALLWSKNFTWAKSQKLSMNLLDSLMKR